MTDPSLPFEPEEYRARLEKTRARMAERGLDALLVTDPANMNYLTGYDAWSFYVPQGVVVTLDRPPVWVGREMDAGAARATTWLDDACVRSYPDDHVQSPEEKHPMDRVAGVIRDLGVGRGTVGVELDAYYYTARAHRRLTERLPEATLPDATLLVNWVRIRKSPREIAYMKQAGRLAGEAMRRAAEAIGPGVRQSRAAAVIYEALIDGTEEFGGDYPAIVPLMPTGRRSSTPHLTWSDRPFREGEPVIIELAGVRHRYHAPLARTLFLGAPPPPIRKTAEAVVAGLEAALDAVRPGVTAETVERAWRETIAGYGLRKESRLGYSCGLGYPPDWGEHTASLRPGDETVLEPDMTFHMIAGMWLEGFGVEMSETFRVTEDGAETLSDVERALLVS